MPAKSFEELLNGYLHNSMTQQELADFLLLLKQQENKEGLLASIYEKLQEPPLQTQPDEAKASRIFENVLQAANPGQQIDSGVPVYQLRRSKTIVFARAAAAVIIVCLLSLSGYIFFNKKETTIGVAEGTANSNATKNDVLAGSNVAVLTLADGTTVSLDDSSNGKLATQGNTVIVKLGGKLDYKASSANGAQLLFNTITTPRGGQYQIQLADGSQVWLNAASSLRFPTAFTGTERRVEVTGEAYFEVAKNKAQPFKVSIAGKGEIEVLGTHFNVNAYDDEPRIYTTLLEGSVKLSNNKKQVTMAPGQQAAFDDKPDITLSNTVDIDEVMAWKNGYFVFNNATTEMIMRQVKRWYNAEIIYEGDVKNERFAGRVPRSANASKLLQVLELTHAVRFTISDNKIIVRPY